MVCSLHVKREPQHRDKAALHTKLCYLYQSNKAVSNQGREKYRSLEEKRASRYILLLRIFSH